MAAFFAQAAGGQIADVERVFALTVGVENSDNPGRQQGALDPEALTYQSLGLDISLAREAQRLQANIDGLLTFYRYNSERFEDQTVGRIEAGINWRVVPSIFDWDIRDVSGDVRGNPFAPPSPENRERLNEFSTGPDFSIPISDRNTLSIEARQLERTWESSHQLDSRVLFGNVLLSRSLSSSRRIGFGVNSRRVDYDEPTAAPYDVDSAYLSFSNEGRRSGNRLDAGTTRLDLNQMTQSNPYLDWRWRARVASRSNLSMGASWKFEDSGDQLSRLEGETDDPSTGDVALANVPIERMRFLLGYSLERPRSTYSFSTDWSDETYEGIPDLDRERSRIAVSIIHPLSRAAELRFDLSHRREEFPQSGDIARDRELSVGANRRLSESFSLVLRYSYFERDSDTLVPSTENRFSLSLAWAPIR